MRSILKRGSSGRSAFTIVEILTVSAVILIITSIGILSYNGWRRSITVSQVSSDLNGVAAVMENSLNFDNAYPTLVPTSFKASSGVILSGGSNDQGKSYCVDSTSSSDNSVHLYISSDTHLQGAQTGTCASQYPAPVITATAVSDSQINIT
jgi:Tfp pilus assembly protein PilE